MKSDNIENEHNNLSVSLIVDPEKGISQDRNLIENMNDIYNLVEFECDTNYNIKINVLKEGFVPGLDLLKEKFKDFSQNNSQLSYNLLCENFIVYLVSNLNFYDALKNHSFSRNSQNIIIENPTAFVIFLRIPNEKLNFFQNNYKVEEFEEGEHLIDENKRSKAIKVIKMFTEELNFDFDVESDMSSEEYKSNILKIFSDLKNQNVKIILNQDQLFKIITNVLNKVDIDYEKFLIILSVILSFSSGLYTFFTVVDTCLQIEIFGEDKDYINIAWAQKYRLMLSSEGKRALSNNQINDDGSKYVKYIYLKYNPNFMNYYQNYNKLTDSVDCVNDHALKSCSSCSNLRNIDKIRILYNIIDGIIKFVDLKDFKHYIKTTFKRDMTNYKKKLSCFCKDFYSPFLVEDTKKTINNFRNIYGEKLGFYFLWMSHLLKWLLILFLLNIIFYYIPSMLLFKKLFLIIPTRTLEYIYTFILIFWITTYVKSWRAYEKKYSRKWGMDECDMFENDREKFKCDYFVTINSTRIPVTSFYKSLYKYSLSFVVTLIMIVITIYFLIIFQNFRTFLKNKTEDLDMIFFTLPEIYKKNLESVEKWVPLMISIYIKIFAYLYKCIATYLTNFENHQKQSQYEYSFIIKTFIFGIINEYYTFYHYIFFSSRKECISEIGSCTQDLIYQLRTILYANLTINLIKEILSPLIFYLYNNYKIKKYLEYKLNQQLSYNDAKFKKYLNDNRHLICSDVSSIFGEYDQIIKIYGYVCQFGCLDPSFFILFGLFVYVQRLVDSYKMIKFHNITAFTPSKGIGVYYKILKVFSYLSLFINIYLLFFIKNYLNFYENSSHFYNFVMVQNVLFFLIYFAEFNFLPSWFNYLSSITFDFSKNLTCFSVEKKTIDPSEIYNNIQVQKEFSSF